MNHTVKQATDPVPRPVLGMSAASHARAVSISRRPQIKRRCETGNLKEKNKYFCDASAFPTRSETALSLQS